MNNWHRKMWTLDPPPQGASTYQKVYNSTLGATNEFWLEPAVYAGPPVTVAFISVTPNTLCYRVQFVGENMNEVWLGLTFFPAGTQPLIVDNTGKPQPDQDTERLQANATIQGSPAVISLYLDAIAPSPGGFRINVSIIGGPGNGGGWAGGHN
jgi:hypothetical protein